MKLTKQQRNRIKELEAFLTNGRPTNGNSIIDLYNEVFCADSKTGRKASYTSCGSCLRRYLRMLVNEKNKQENEIKERMRKIREAKKQTKAASLEKKTASEE